MLEHIQPTEVFTKFEQICSIPHGSGNVKQISNFLVEFAKERNLWHRQDSMGNVVIAKEATPGMEEKETMIIQGHMDMVAVKEDSCNKDMTRDGLDLVVDGDYISAEGTSLGADDGIAVAYALAILDSDDIPHPPLEVVITVDEEVGLIGAGAIDLSDLKGHTLLNIDSETESELIVSCAGGVTVSARWNVDWVEAEGDKYKVMLTGLTGGHSGTEIDKGRANANKLMTELLYLLEREVDISLLSVKGGNKDNVIPCQAEAYFCSRAEEKQITELIATMEEALKAEWKETDPGLSLSLQKLEREADKQEMGLETSDFFRLASFFLEVPNGVQAMSSELPGLPETSLNLGVFSLENQGKMEAGFLVRSSVEDAKNALTSRLRKMITESQGSFSKSGEYSGWEYRKNSPLRDKMVEIYKEHFGKEPKVLSIHAGLECGMLAQKIKNLDAVSFGPDMHDIHTTDERLSISSTRRVWEYLKKILAD